MLEMSPVELVVVDGISPANDACRVTPRDGASGSTPVKMTTKDETVFRLSTCRGLAFFRLSTGRLERALLVQIHVALNSQATHQHWMAGGGVCRMALSGMLSPAPLCPWG